MYLKNMYIVKTYCCGIPLIVKNVKKYCEPTTISFNYIYVFQIQFYMF